MRKVGKLIFKNRGGSFMYKKAEMGVGTLIIFIAMLLVAAVAAGVDRYNHNLNTSNNYYGEICSTHEYQERVRTIKTAKDKGLDICSGVILGMGETLDDIIQMISELKAVEVDSVPVNFFVPLEGHRISNYHKPTPHYCLKVLSVFHLALPQAEIRAAAGREYHLRSLQALGLYAVNSIFAQGYLTTGGDTLEATKKMIDPKY